jgi:uncharacterized protein (DUF58 family)
LHPEAIRRISRLELRAGRVVEGYLAGIHRSPYFGNSIEFRQHREYTSGDDFRHVDWKVWARNDRFYVKQYEAETNVRCALLVDVSSSMSYGSGALNKYEYACTAAASLAYLMLKQQDAVGCLAFDDRVRAVVPQRTQRGHLASIIKSLDRSRPAGKSEISTVLRRAAEEYPRRGFTILISDLLVPRPPLLAGIRDLRARGHDVIVFHILDDDELDFPFSGPSRFEGLELPEHLACNPRALRQGYLEALEEYLDEVRRGCGAYGADYTLIRTSQPLDAVLTSYLNRRLAGQRAR